jgi:hypothetical protein
MTAAAGRVRAGTAARTGGGQRAVPGCRSAIGGLDFGAGAAPEYRPGKPRNQERQMLTLRREDGAC